MFDSSFFSMDLMLFYIDKREESGVIDTLINFMYKKFINESFFYLPQLCTMLTYKIQTDSLENYILDRCVDQMKFSLKVHWLINSYYENETNPKISKLFDKLLQKIEVTLVNGRRCTASNYSQHNLQKKAIMNNATIEIYNNSIDKELRQKYFDKCQDFYQQLKSMCEKLKNFPKESNRPNNRNAILKDYIFMYNLNFENLKSEIGLEQDHSSIVKNFYKGVILPFDDSFSTLDEHNSIIVRIIPEYCFCFSTKARVPVKLSVECIRVIECFKWEELYLNETGERSTVEDKFKSKEEFDLKLKNTLQMQSVQDEEFCLLDNNFSQSKMTKSLNDFMNDVKQNKFKDENIAGMSFKQKEKDDLIVIDFNPDVINPFGKKWTEVCQEIREKSPFRKFETYSIKNFIAKANDDLRQELMTMQLIKKFDEIFTKAEINLKIRPYEILITSSSSGLIEFLPNTNSIDGVKKKLPPKWNLNNFYRNFFSDHFEEAQKNFAESLAAYSLLSYFIQIKDRHNGNILIDMKGHIIHIDFGFILGINPGNVNFESAPFKLTSEYVEILDGLDSPIFEYYKSLMLRGFMEAKKHVDSMCKIIEIMSRGKKLF
jgi:phosphatidylinositol 4-kinase B